MDLFKKTKENIKTPIVLLASIAILLPACGGDNKPKEIPDLSKKIWPIIEPYYKDLGINTKDIVPKNYIDNGASASITVPSFDIKDFLTSPESKINATVVSDSLVKLDSKIDLSTLKINKDKAENITVKGNYSFVINHNIEKDFPTDVSMDGSDISLILDIEDERGKGKILLDTKKISSKTEFKENKTGLLDITDTTSVSPFSIKLTPPEKKGDITIAFGESKTDTTWNGITKELGKILLHSSSLKNYYIESEDEKRKINITPIKGSLGNMLSKSAINKVQVLSSGKDQKESLAEIESLTSESHLKEEGGKLNLDTDIFINNLSFDLNKIIENTSGGVKEFFENISSNEKSASIINLFPRKLSIEIDVSNLGLTKLRESIKDKDILTNEEAEQTLKLIDLKDASLKIQKSIHADVGFIDMKAKLGLDDELKNTGKTTIKELLDNPSNIQKGLVANIEIRVKNIEDIIDNVSDIMPIIALYAGFIPLIGEADPNDESITIFNISIEKDKIKINGKNISDLF